MPLRRFPVLLVVFVFIGAILILGRLEPRARWLRVEAPKAAIAGEILELRITIGALPEPVKLGCNLNWARKNRERAGMLASGSPYPTVKDASTTIFRIPVHEKEGLAFVSAIIYLTPTGSWGDSLRAAYTETVPVKPAGTPAAGIPWKRLKVFPSTAGGIMSPVDGPDEDEGESRFRLLRPSAGRTMLAVFLLAGAVMSFFNHSHRRPSMKGLQRKGRSLWVVFSLVFGVASLAEFAGIPGTITGWGRKLAEDWGLYYFRTSFQKPLTAAFAAVGVAALYVFLSSWKRRLLDTGLGTTGLGLAVYLLATFASMLSYHPIDVLRGFSFLGVSVMNLAKAFGATIALAGTLAGIRGAKRSPSD